MPRRRFLTEEQDKKTIKLIFRGGINKWKFDVMSFWIGVLTYIIINIILRMLIEL